MTNTDDDNLAGEFVLGTLDSEERAAANARRASDAGFDRAVTAWEDRLAPLDEATPEASPTTDLWSAILARIAALGATLQQPVRPDARVVVLSRQVTRWRQVAASMMALAAALALWIVVGPFGGTSQAKPQLVAILMKGGYEPAYLMSVSTRDDSVAVRPLAAKTPEGKSYELWIIDSTLGPPRSLGTIDPSSPVHKIPNGVAPDVVARATYAVTLEPLGGSPTGAPSGAPVFVGHAVETP
jgi:anti-sigma-K factor RskA